MHKERIILSIVLLLAGIASLLFGAIFHTVSVEEQKQREISIMVPTLPGMDDLPSPGEARADDDAMAGELDPFRTPPGGAPGGSENPFENPAAPPALPGMRLEKAFETYTEAHEEPEWAIVREVTFGGVARLANGQLKRTYSGKPPALCPS